MNNEVEFVMSRVRCWPGTVMKTLAVTVAMAALTASAGMMVRDGQTIAFLGDSITEMGAWSAGYISMTMKGLEIAGVRDLKDLRCGQSGNTSREMKKRLDWVLCQKPDLLLISCGVNDAWHVARGCKLEDYKVNMGEMFDKAAASNVAVVVMTPTMLKEVEDNDLNARLEPYLVWLRAEAKRRNLVVADVNAFEHAELKRLEREGKRKKSNNFTADDGIHMMYPGNCMIATCLLRTFGADPALQSQFDAAWRQLPGAINLRVLLSVDEYERLKAAGVKDQVYQVEKYAHDALFSDGTTWRK